MVTNYIKGASYKEIYDLHTDTKCSSILTIHSPVTSLPREMLGGFFDQYRRFKYRGVQVKLRPASRLPADPLQISYEAGEPTIDPRDMLNPILARGYCGDSLGYFLNNFMQPGIQHDMYQATAGGNVEDYYTNGFFGSSADKTSFPVLENRLQDPRELYLEKLYYQSLSDPGFYKIPQQKGYSRFMKPLVYELATTTQRLARSHKERQIVSQAPPLASGNPSNASINASMLEETNRAYLDSDGPVAYNSASSTPNRPNVNDSSDAKLATNTGTTSNEIRVYRHTYPMLTSNKRRLGWLDTDTVVVRPTDGQGDSSTSHFVNGNSLGSSGATYADYSGILSAPKTLFGDGAFGNTTLPLINMMVLCLPKAYKTEMYYRLELTHVFDFKDYRPLKGLVSPFDESSIEGGYLEWADWDDMSSLIAGSSVTSTSKNFELVDAFDTSNESVQVD